MLDDLFANTFGVKETRLRGDDTEYAEYAQYRLPDEPGSAYTETVFQARLVDGHFHLQLEYVTSTLKTTLKIR